MYGGIKIMQKTKVKILKGKRSIEALKLLDGVKSVESRLRFVGRLIDERDKITKDDSELMQELLDFVSEQIKFEVSFLKLLN